MTFNLTKTAANAHEKLLKLEDFKEYVEDNCEVILEYVKKLDLKTQAGRECFLNCAGISYEDREFVVIPRRLNDKNHYIIYMGHLTIEALQDALGSSYPFNLNVFIDWILDNTCYTQVYVIPCEEFDCLILELR